MLSRCISAPACTSHANLRVIPVNALASPTKRHIQTIRLPLARKWIPRKKPPELTTVDSADCARPPQRHFYLVAVWSEQSAASCAGRSKACSCDSAGEGPKAFCTKFSDLLVARVNRKFTDAGKSDQE